MKRLTNWSAVEVEPVFTLNVVVRPPQPLYARAGFGRMGVAMVLLKAEHNSNVQRTRLSGTVEATIVLHATGTGNGKAQGLVQ
jgi:hypothetical protein